MPSQDNPTSFPLIFEQSREQRRALHWPEPDVPTKPLTAYFPATFLREEAPPLPQVSELQVVRHYTRLSQRNIGVDDSFYPLGSCTMKYNPKVNEHAAALPGFLKLHPYQPEQDVQGILALMFELQEALQEISGLAAVSLQPAAGAHGEMTSVMIIKAYHRDRGAKPHVVLIPDSAHGTNPASCTVCAYKTVTVKTDARGNVDLEDLEAKLNSDVAAFMITNPSTLGLFEENILTIAQRVHAAGALLYMDGANLNALLGITRPGDFGVDVMHFNLHKTFSTPHGGGGPGAGPIAVTAQLAKFLPVPVVARNDQGYYLNYDIPKTIGKTRAVYGNVGVLIRAYCYIRALGPSGLQRVSQMAVLNANYLMARLKDDYHLPYDRHCMHEFVLAATHMKDQGVKGALDVAKRLLDMGFHPPTIYFPLIVPEALMIEPTETETKETLDAFCQALLDIHSEFQEEPWKLKEAPFNTPVTRLDEVTAARQPILRWEG